MFDTCVSTFLWPRQRRGQTVPAAAFGAAAPLAVCALLAVAAPAHASTVTRLGALERIQRADLIVEGIVMDVASRNSDVTAAQPIGLPHMFVTLAIERVFKGTPGTGRTLTIRMLGGPDGNGRFMKVAGVPDLRVGDRDILFIQNRDSDICPLVGWEQGRIRLVRDQTYDEFGQEVWITPQGDFVAGEPIIDVNDPTYPDLVRTHRDREAAANFVPPAGSARASCAGFGTWLTARIADLDAHGDLRRAEPVPGADISLPFFAPAFAAAPPPQQTPAAPATLLRGEFDAREAELIGKLEAMRKARQ